MTGFASPFTQRGTEGDLVGPRMAQAYINDKKTTTQRTEKTILGLYPSQNGTQVSNRCGSIFRICNQSDLEAGFYFSGGPSSSNKTPDFHSDDPIRTKL